MGTSTASGTVQKRKTHIQKPKKYKVLMHNDDFTSMDFVVEVLMGVFGKSEMDAILVMQNIHFEGIGLCGVYIMEIAESKIAQTKEMAKASKFPLKCTMEEE
jgi:ATP-dependent Clp protease adaptor protein ClpS